MPTATQVAALAYLTIAVTAVVFIAWFGAMERLGADRTGLFNGLIPVTSLAAVVLTGTGTLTPLRLLGALAVLAGVVLGLGRSDGRSSAWPDDLGGRRLITLTTTTNCGGTTRSCAGPTASSPVSMSWTSAAGAGRRPVRSRGCPRPAVPSGSTSPGLPSSGRVS
jgi:hypothetical protein